MVQITRYVLLLFKTCRLIYKMKCNVIMYVPFPAVKVMNKKDISASAREFIMMRFPTYQK